MPASLTIPIAAAREPLKNVQARRRPSSRKAAYRQSAPLLTPYERSQSANEIGVNKMNGGGEVQVEQKHLRNAAA